MTNREAFVQAIREKPEDIPLRLVFADWLEEQGDPLAEFIRVQCELEPLRHDYDDARANELRQREKELLEAHKLDWLGPLTALEGNASRGTFLPVFRNGLVEEIQILTEQFLEYGQTIERWYPCLQKVTLFNLRDQAKELATAAELCLVRHLAIADWITDDDAFALAECPFLSQLQKLTIWLGGQNQESTCRTFAFPSSFSELRELELVQLLGGLAANERAGELDKQADALAEMANRVRGRRIASVYRPYDRLFPIRGDSGRDFYTGRSSDGRQCLILNYYPDSPSPLVFFDQHGDLTEVVQCEQTSEILSAADETALWLYLKARFGIHPGLIRVKEFSLPEVDGLSVYFWSGHLVDILESPETIPESLMGEERWISGFMIESWMKWENFVILWGNDYWAGPDGAIHSS